MTPESQQIAIAQFLFPEFEWFDNGLRWRNPENGHEGPGRDYLSDLNAMHEAEKVLTDEQKVHYVEELAKLSMPRFYASHDNTHPDWHFVRATAAQRAEAVLRTLGLWKD